MRSISVVALAAFIVVGAAGGANPPAYTTPQQVFDAMRGAFQPRKAAGVHARYQWNLREPMGGKWFIEVDDGKSKVGRGTIANANVTFVASGKDWVAISNGKLNGTWAFLTGRLKIQGDQGLARKLDEMFP